MVLLTPRLELVPITLPMVEAVLACRRKDAEALAGAIIPDAWPGPALIERAFPVTLEALRAAPEVRLWGARLMITPGPPRRVVGSVVFHGPPGPEGVVEVAYGVEEGSQGKGYATEGVRAAIEWALAQAGVRAVIATTPPWHRSSLRVLQKCGMGEVGTTEHETLGELLVLERRRA